MRIDLERLDVRALSFVSAGDPPHYRAVVRDGQGVRGALTRAPAELSIRELGAEKLVLDALQLLFGTLLIDSARETVIEQLTGALRSSAALLELSLGAQGLRAEPLTVRIGAAELGANARMRGVVLRIGKDGGSLQLGELELHDFQAQAADFSAQAPLLSARQFELGWGLELRISAAQIDVPELIVRRGTRATLTLQELRCSDLALRGPHVLLGGLAVKRAQLKQVLGSPEPQPSAPAPAQPPPAPSAHKTPRKIVALDLLDGLSGRLLVDVQVDMTIPIFGTRRAKHELRLSVEEGSVDYRELESNLAPLENALLDFSVRGSELVLERGIPLLPTRGFGKPILRWQLSPRDRELAERDRVRLALLPQFQPARASRAERDDDDDEPGNSALRKLGLNVLDFSLSLAPVAVPGIALRGVSIEQLRVRGAIQYHLSDVDPEGVLSGEMRGLALSVDALSLGTRELSLQKLQVARVPRWLMRFAGLSPTALELELEDISLLQLRLA